MITHWRRSSIILCTDTGSLLTASSLMVLTSSSQRNASSLAAFLCPVRLGCTRGGNGWLTYSSRRSDITQARPPPTGALLQGRGLGLRLTPPAQLDWRQGQVSSSPLSQLVNGLLGEGPWDGWVGESGQTKYMLGPSKTWSTASPVPPFELFLEIAQLTYTEGNRCEKGIEWASFRKHLFVRTRCVSDRRFKAQQMFISWPQIQCRIRHSFTWFSNQRRAEVHT